MSDSASEPQFIRPTPPRIALPLLSQEAARLARFRPPFRFTSFFSPEDTLLCVMAADGAARRLVMDGAAGRLASAHDSPRVVELTAGSGLVGFSLLDALPGATLYGIDVDAEAPAAAASNAATLGLADRARFEHLSLWDDALPTRLAAERPALVVCNPPYIPEPPGERLAVEAGSGPDGAEHVRRAIELAAGADAPGLVLSWCSLCDPAGVVRDAARAGYRLDELFVVAIADGDYSGSVYDYLKTLPTAFLNDWPETVQAIAPDDAARFVYLLLAGAFTRVVDGAPPHDGSVPAAALDLLVHRFAERGPATLRDPRMPVPTHCWALDRWDEVALRVALHGPVGDLVSPVRTRLRTSGPHAEMPE